MKLYHISAIPTIQASMQKDSSAGSLLRTEFEKLLHQISTLAQGKALAIELIFASFVEPENSGEQLALYLTLHGDNTASVEETVLRQLLAQNYSLEKLGDIAAEGVVNKLQKASAAEMKAVIKTEKLVTSSISYAGYYYYADTLKPGKDKRPDNFSSLLNALRECPDSYVSFQLLPTVMQPNEMYALSDLSSSLEQVVRGLYMHGQLVREPFAEAPQKAYSYYAQRGLQPLFLFNIVVGSMHRQASLLAAQALTILQSASDNPVAVESISLLENAWLAQDYELMPWRLNDLLQQRYRNPTIWNGGMVAPINLARLPFLITPEEASVFFRLPVDDGNIAGIRSNRLPQNKDVIDQAVQRYDNIALGKTRGASSISIGAPLKAFTQHALIVGMPGTGKTTFSISLLLQFHRSGIPFLAIEPTKTEYRAMIDAIPDLQIFTPGNNEVAPFIINPFLPPRGITLEQYVPSLASAFKAAFSMPQPLDMIFLSAIRKCYAEYGWKNHSRAGDKDVRPFGMYEFILTFKRLVASLNYGKEVMGNIQSGGTLRLLNLIEQNSNIYDTIHTVPLEDLLSKPTVLELNAIDNYEYKSLLMALLLINICVYTKHNQAGDGKLKNIILIDEAHVLLGGRIQTDSERADAQGTTIKALQDMVAEIRSYGTGMIIADQAPSKVSREIVANTDIKVAFRLVGGQEKEIIADATGMEESTKQHLSRLGVGEAFAYYRLLESPQLIITPDVREQAAIRLSVENVEIVRRMNYWQTREAWLKPFYECAYSESCRKNCSFPVRAQADFYAEKLADAFSPRIKDKNTLAKYLLKLHEMVIYYEQNSSDKSNLKRLCNCTKIRFIRKLALTLPFQITDEERRKFLTDSLIKEVTSHV